MVKSVKPVKLVRLVGLAVHIRYHPFLVILVKLVKSVLQGDAVCQGDAPAKPVFAGQTGFKLVKTVKIVQMVKTVGDENARAAAATAPHRRGDSTNPPIPPPPLD